MNYRHIYHAGNICDVVKHTTLMLVTQCLRAKDTAFCVLDTHAGTGLYDLHDERALKTGEAESGIYRFLASHPIDGLSEYYSILCKLNSHLSLGSIPSFRFYPGSPLLISMMLRSQDKLIACELHLEDAQELRRRFRGRRQVHIHMRDGYEALRAFLPPAEKRGFILVDPPYENPDEFDRLLRELKDAHRCWPQGTFIIWYPIKERPALWRFHEALIATGIAHQLCAEYIYREETRHDRLNGCGLILVNPPWQMDEKLAALFPALHKAMGSILCGTEIKWLTKT